MDLGVFSSALASIQSATEIAKLLKESKDSLEQAEVRFKLAELMNALADARMQMADVKEALAHKEQEISSLRDELRKRDDVIWDNPYYWCVIEDKKEGPFCQKCYDESQRLIRLQGTGGRWRCLSCKSTFTDSSYAAPPPKRRAAVPYNPFVSNW